MMIGLDAQTLALAMLGCPLPRAQVWAPHLDKAMMVFEINSPTRAADFLAQIGHESSGLQWVRELWGPEQVPEQKTYERDFASPWNAQLVRGNRNYKAFNMGNAQEGDGYRFRGRSPIQLTGRKNYATCRDRLRELLGVAAVPDFEVDPAAIEQPEWGAMVAGDFWGSRGLNAYADRLDFIGETERINGGQNGLADRIERRKRARKALGLDAA